MQINTNGTVIEYTQCKNCFEKFDKPHQNGWCDKNCYEQLLENYNNKFNISKSKEYASKNTI
jgi:hypothetical protein